MPVCAVHAAALAALVLTWLHADWFGAPLDNPPDRMPHLVLNADQARQLYDAKRRVTAARAELEAAETAQRELRDEFKKLVPVARKPKDQARGVLEVIAGGVKVRISASRTGRSFRFGDYLAAGGRITKTMRPHVGEPVEYDRWTITVVDEDEFAKTAPQFVAADATAAVQAAAGG
jgi:hypothetical protein